MDSTQLQAGLEYLRFSDPTSVFAAFRNAFLAIERYPNKAAATFQKLLGSDDPIARLFGAALAVRPRLFIDPAFVALAASVEDEEVVKLVREATEAPLPPWAEWNGSDKAG